jgi:hypothetical protein
MKTIYSRQTEAFDPCRSIWKTRRPETTQLSTTLDKSSSSERENRICHFVGNNKILFKVDPKTQPLPELMAGDLTHSRQDFHHQSSFAQKTQSSMHNRPEQTPFSNIRDWCYK